MLKRKSYALIPPRAIPVAVGATGLARQERAWHRTSFPTPPSWRRSRAGSLAASAAELLAPCPNDATRACEDLPSNWNLWQRVAATKLWSRVGRTARYTQEGDTSFLCHEKPALGKKRNQKKKKRARVCQVYDYELVSIRCQINVHVCVFSPSPRHLPFFLFMMKRSALVLSAWEGAWATLERTMCSHGPQRRPHPGGVAGVRSQPQSLCTAQTKDPILRRGCSFSWSDDSFQLTKDSGQGSEESGWLMHAYDFTLRTGSRGVTLQIPKASPWAVGSGPQGQWWTGMGWDASCLGKQEGRRKEDYFFPPKSWPVKVHSQSLFKVLFVPSFWTGTWANISRPELSEELRVLELIYLFFQVDVLR